MTEGLPARPHSSRRRHQAALNRERRQRWKRRRARLQRIRLWKTIRNARFWGRTALVLVLLCTLVFWSKYAIVYDIPDFAQRSRLAHVQMYVTEKPWWFGPPVFDVSSYGPASDQLVDNTTAYSLLLDKLGRYQDVLLYPRFVWVSKP